MVANQLARWTPEPRCSRSRSLAPPPRPRRQTGGAGDRGGGAGGTRKGQVRDGWHCVCLRCFRVHAFRSSGEKRSRERRNAMLRRPSERATNRPRSSDRTRAFLSINASFSSLPHEPRPPRPRSFVSGGEVCTHTPARQTRTLYPSRPCPPRRAHCNQLYEEPTND